MVQPSNRRFVMEDRLDAERAEIDAAIATKITNPAQTANIADGAVTSAKIADGTIVAGDLASNSVTTAKITDLNVTTAKLADGAVTSAKIANGTITTADLASLDSVQFNTLFAGGSTAPGMIAWNDTDGTLEFQLKGGNVTLQIGQEQVVRVKNNTGGTLDNGKAVYISGSDGSNLRVAYANAGSESTSSGTIGILTEDLNNGNAGFVTTFGLVRKINTSALTEGAAVWLSTTNGGLTSTRPTAPNHSVMVGFCLRSHATNGVIFVRVDNGWELDELHNVLITTPTNGQALTYDNGIWKNATPASSLSGYYSPNYIINGAFEINQRGFSSTVTGSTFGFDRFYFIRDAAGSSTYSAQKHTPGISLTTGHEAENFARLVTSGQTATSTYTALIQNVEDIRLLAGKTVTVSLWAKAASGTPKIALEVAQSFGSGGSPSASTFTYGGQVTLSTSWQRYSFTVTVPSISGKTVGTTLNSSYTQFAFWVSAGSDYNARLGSLGIQSNTFDFWGIQVEEGAVATPFRRNANSIQGELAACQRYYFRIVASGASSRVMEGTPVGTLWSTSEFITPVPMRTNQPVTTLSGSWVLSDGASVFPFTSFGLWAQVSTSVYPAYQATASGLTAFRTHRLEAAYGGGGYIEFSAEL